ncbi:MAG: tetratricopeptide repeat protein [Marinifilaceae bacterium]
MVKIRIQTGRVIAVMTLLTIVAVIFAWFYYSGINSSEDPRVIEAKRIYANYSRFSEAEDFGGMISSLDSIQAIYKSVDHYADSYEMGVIHNNRCAIFLHHAIHKCEDSILRKKNIDTANEYANKSIAIYNGWIKEFGSLNTSEVKTKISADFALESFDLSDQMKEKILDKRVEEILDAQFEISRRLSVCYTNWGIILRHKEKYQEAGDCYVKAMKLWKENLTAKNNLNILLGRPQEKRSMIKKLFPEDRKER